MTDNRSREKTNQSEKDGLFTCSGFRASAAFVISWGLRLFINFIAFVGIALIGYELIASYYKSRWPVLDIIATCVSTWLTLIGTLFMALSIYFYSERPTPPEKISIYVTAPFVSGACVVAMILLLKYGSMPAHVLNGFALLAIAGALLRIQPNPLKDERLYWRRATKACGKTQGSHLNLK